MSFSSPQSSVSQPIQVPISQSWVEDEGFWSSFTLEIGTPPQSVELLVSTSSNQVWTPLPHSCSPCSLHQPSCDVTSASTYNYNASATWANNTFSKDGCFTLPADIQPGQRSTGFYGFDNLSLGDSVKLNHQVVAGLAGENIHSGFLGLHPAATNFSRTTEPVRSFMSSLKASGHIPSTSYGYTAGNRYRSEQIRGSLTLGGYDSSLVDHNDLVFPFAKEFGSEVVVDIQAIQALSSTQDRNLTAKGFNAKIDTTTPFLHLPGEVCDAFEDTFGLTFDESTHLYYFNRSQEASGVSTFPNVVFTLTNSTKEVQINITFPLQSLNSTTKQFSATNLTQIFPIKRAIDDDHIILGRTFLREAYLIADYERSQFSLHQRRYLDEPVTPQIQAILPLRSIATPASSPGNFSTNTKAAIAVSVIIASTMMIGISICLILAIRRRRHHFKSLPTSIEKRYHDWQEKRSLPRLKISKPIPIPLSSPTFISTSNSYYSRSPSFSSSSERSALVTVALDQHQPTPDVDSQVVSPVSPVLRTSDKPPTISLAARLSRTLSFPRRAQQQSHYQQLYDNIVDEVRGKVFVPTPPETVAGLPDPFVEQTGPPTKMTQERDGSKKTKPKRRDTAYPRPRPRIHISTLITPDSSPIAPIGPPSVISRFSPVVASKSPKTTRSPISPLATAGSISRTPKLISPLLTPTPTPTKSPTAMTHLYNSGSPTTQIHELPSTPGLRPERSIARDLAQIYSNIDDIEKAMIQEGQRRRNQALMRRPRTRGRSKGSKDMTARKSEESRGSGKSEEMARRFSAIGAGWI